MAFQQQFQYVTPPRPSESGPPADARGAPPLRRRWRLYCFRRVFVIEPNVVGYGLRYRPRELREWVRVDGGSRGAAVHEEAQAVHHPGDLPQLIIFRESTEIVEVKSTVHQLYKSFGNLQKLWLIDSLIGIVQIADARFLSVVNESEAVAGFSRSALTGGPVPRPLNLFDPTTATPHTNGDSSNNFSCLPSIDAFDAYAYRVRRVWLIPFHLSLDRLQPQLSVLPPPTTASPRVFLNEPHQPHSRVLYADGGGHTCRAASGGDSVSAAAAATALTHALHVDTSLPNLLAAAGDLTSGGGGFGRRARRVSAALLPYGGGGSQQVSSQPQQDLHPPSLHNPRNGSSCDDNLGYAYNAYESNGGEVTVTTSRLSSDEPVTVVSSSGGVVAAPTDGVSAAPTMKASAVTWEQFAYGGFGDPMFNSLLGEKLAAYKAGVERLLGSSVFYFSYDIDLTHTLQRKSDLGFVNVAQGWPCADQRQQQAQTQGHNHTGEPSCSVADVALMQIADPRFCWNAPSCMPFLTAAVDKRWLTPLVQGSITSATVALGIHGLDLTLLSRRSCQRPGTRYIHRGLSDSGAVANFNESEFLVCVTRVDPKSGRVINRSSGVAGGSAASYVQIRGSVPLFWTQQATGLNLNPTPHVSRELGLTWPAFALHQAELHQVYGDVTYVDLLSMSGKIGEQRLGLSLHRMLRAYNDIQTEHSQEVRQAALDAAAPGEAANVTPPSGRGRVVRHVRWDFHQRVKQRGFEAAMTEFYQELASDARKFGFFSVSSSNFTSSRQTGVFRTNCLDCLDRTNAAQWTICWAWLSQYLSQKGLRSLLVPGEKLTEVSAAEFEVDFDAVVIAQLSEGGRLLIVRSFGGDAANDNIVGIYRAAKGGETDSGMEVSEAAVAVLKEAVAVLWAELGDHVSKAYTGTGSVLSSLLRQGRSSLSTNMNHVWTSIGRLYQNTFEDPGRQDAIDVFLRRHCVLSAPPPAERPIDRRMSPDPPNGSAGAAKKGGQPTSHLNLPNIAASTQREGTNSSVATNSSTSRPDSPRPADTERARVSVTQIRGVPKPPLVPAPIAPTEDYVHMNLRIWAGTWNVGGRKSCEPLEKWLFCNDNGETNANGASSCSGSNELCDIYVVAIQELVELTGFRVLMSSNDREKEARFALHITHVLGPEFTLLAAHGLVGLYFLVFVRNLLAPSISQVQTSEVKLGFKGQMGNKGAVLIRFLVGVTSFCFGNIHLISGLDKAVQRQQQLTQILGASFQGRNSYTVRHHDVVILCGDFNFRCSHDPAQGSMLAHFGMWHELLFTDQYLLGKRQRIPVFCELRESPILFLPTYKFRKDSPLYDRSRTPSWCDRIFYLGAYSQPDGAATDNDWLTCTRYGRVSEFLSSDHRPVFAELTARAILPAASLHSGYAHRILPHSAARPGRTPPPADATGQSAPSHRRSEGKLLPNPLSRTTSLTSSRTSTQHSSHLPRLQKSEQEMQTLQTPPVTPPATPSPLLHPLRSPAAIDLLALDENELADGSKLTARSSTDNEVSSSSFSEAPAQSCSSSRTAASLEGLRAVVQQPPGIMTKSAEAVGRRSVPPPDSLNGADELLILLDDDHQLGVAEAPPFVCPAGGAPSLLKDTCHRSQRAQPLPPADLFDPFAVQPAAANNCPASKRVGDGGAGSSTNTGGADASGD